MMEATVPSRLVMVCSLAGAQLSQTRVGRGLCSAPRAGGPGDSMPSVVPLLKFPGWEPQGSRGLAGYHTVEVSALTLP